MTDVMMAKLTWESTTRCSAAGWCWERRIYINVPMAVFVPLTAAFTNQKGFAEKDSQVGRVEGQRRVGRTTEVTNKRWL